MACPPTSNLESALLDGRFIDAIRCVFTNQLGEPVASLLVLGPVAIAFYVYADNPVLPTVVFLITGSLFVTTLPSVALQLAGIVTILGGTFVSYLLLQRGERRV